MENKVLFSLVPLSPAATRIVQVNPSFHDVFQRSKCLSFKAGNKSRFPGRIVSIGQLLGINDVILPGDGYAQLQCSFYLVPTGELMLEDHTSGHHTYIDWTDNHGKQEKYSLQGDPRRRIIPMVDTETLKIGINLGQDVSFQFFWEKSFKSAQVERTRTQLAQIAQKTFIGGMSLTVPRDPNLEPTAYEPRTVNTPVVPVEYDGRPLRQVHVYKTIGEGGFGSVSQAVDLATGRIWAVKECRNPDKKGVGESWKAGFKREVEKLASLRHPSIIRLEHHQGWSLGRPVQIFLPLCTGTVADLLPKDHRCKENPKSVEPWLCRFIDQILSGLAFMHKNGVVHRDIKPQNILFDQKAGESSLSFYIADFGLVVSKESVCLPAGTPIYMAPETTRNGTCGPESDVYSFGLTLLRVLGKYCEKELDFKTRHWQDKLKGYGAQKYRNYSDKCPPKAFMPEMQVFHSRIQSLSDFYLIRTAVQHLLYQDPKSRTTASEARQELLETYYAPPADRAPRPVGGIPSPAPRVDRRPTGRRKEIPIRAR